MSYIKIWLVKICNDSEQATARRQGDDAAIGVEFVVWIQAEKNKTYGLASQPTCELRRRSRAVEWLTKTSRKLATQPRTTQLLMLLQLLPVDLCDVMRRATPSPATGR